MRTTTRQWVALVTVGIATISVAQIQGENAKIPTVRIGMIQTLFRGTPANRMLAQTGPIATLLETQTGVRSEVSVVPTAHDMAKRIHDGELDLGVLHGIEFAWTRKDFPNLQALVIVYNETYKLRGYVVVRADSGYESCADLKGKAVAWPKYNLNHTYLFTHHIVKETGCDPTGFFAPGEPVPSTEGSLDHVYDKKAAAAVVDGLAWNFYRGEKPGRAARLKIMKESEIFPTATIIYNPRAADDKVMDKVYKGLTSAHERVIGRQMLTLWRVTNFSKVPEEYEQMLTDVLKVFPEPVQPAAFMPAPVEKATATGGMN